MTADKFGREYAKYPESVTTDAATSESVWSEHRDVMREALREAWAIFDRLGEHQSDEHLVAVIHSPEFASAAYRVRTAMLRTARKA
jgi:hypothetical protein